MKKNFRYLTGTSRQRQPAVRSGSVISAEKEMQPAALVAGSLPEFHEAKDAAVRPDSAFPRQRIARNLKKSKKLLDKGFFW